MEIFKQTTEIMVSFAVVSDRKSQVVNSFIVISQFYASKRSSVWFTMWNCKWENILCFTLFGW